MYMCGDPSFLRRHPSFLCVLACFVFERWSLIGLQLMDCVRLAGPRDLLPVSASQVLRYKHPLLH